MEKINKINISDFCNRFGLSNRDTQALKKLYRKEVKKEIKEWYKIIILNFTIPIKIEQKRFFTLKELATEDIEIVRNIAKNLNIQIKIDFSKKKLIELILKKQKNA